MSSYNLVEDCDSEETETVGQETDNHRKYTDAQCDGATDGEPYVAASELVTLRELLGHAEEQKVRQDRANNGRCDGTGEALELSEIVAVGVSGIEGENRREADCHQDGTVDVSEEEITNVRVLFLEYVLDHDGDGEEEQGHR